MNRLLTVQAFCATIASGRDCQDSSCRRDHGEEFPYVCDWCLEPCAELFTVDDSDPSTGYHDELNVCETCKEKYGRS